jgi:hypothetical protein
LLRLNLSLPLHPSQYRSQPPLLPHQSLRRPLPPPLARPRRGHHRVLRVHLRPRPGCGLWRLASPTSSQPQLQQESQMSDKASLESLGLGKEVLEGAEFDAIPEGIGQSYPDPPQPGTYRFRLPPSGILKGCFAVVESTKYGKRINAIFEDDSALVIVQSPGKSHDNEEFRWRCSNIPRERTKEKILVSDMDLLLRVLGKTTRPKTNADYGKALVSVAGMEFTATNEFSWNCSPQREIYVDDGNGGTGKVEGKMGCGNRYYQRDVTKVLSDPMDPTSARVYPVRITCSNPECGANIRAFPNLTGFKA